MEREHLSLSRVVGLTSLSNTSFLSSPDGNIFYAAGCVCVVYNPQTNKQVKFFTVTKAISSMHLSEDGRFLAIGERGHLPCVTVWDVKKQKQIRCYSGHEHGIGAVRFSPNGKYLVTIGFRHDKQMMLYEWDIDRLICVERMEKKVNAVSFHSSGDFFVTCGDRHLKWWYLVSSDTADGSAVSGLNGRPASILKAQEDCNFVDVACCRSNVGGGEICNVYCTTSSGMLCLVHEKRLMEKWVQLDSTSSYCLTLTSSFVIVGGTSGDAFVFNPVTLEFIATLPHPAPLSFPFPGENKTDLEFASCFGLCFIPTTTCVAAMYDDRSIFIWDISDILNPVKFKSFVFHKACIWDVVFIEQSARNDSLKALLADEPAPISTSGSEFDKRGTFPPGTFATCGADNTICLWNLDPKNQRQSKWKSPYSRDLLHCFQLDGNRMSDRDKDRLSFPDIELPDRQQGSYIARALAVHPNGNELACGDKQGRMYVIDLSTMKSILTHQTDDSSRDVKVESHGFRAHEAEILTLSYSPYYRASLSGEITADNDSKENLVLLASAGRDRLIHVFDATEDSTDAAKRYCHVKTLDSHSSSVTVVKFTLDGKTLVSCGGDKTMVLHSVTNTEVKRKKSINTPHGTINGITLDIATNKYAVSTGQDKRVNVWNLASGKLLRSYRPGGLGGEMYKCSMDPSGTFIATCSFDKVIRIFDFFSGEIVAEAFGHSDLVTGVKFSPDGKSLISIGGDGCIMMWNLSQPMIREMEDRLLELYAQAERKAAKVNEKARLVATGDLLHQVPSIPTCQPKPKSSGGVRREKKTIRTGGVGSLVGSHSDAVDKSTLSNVSPPSGDGPLPTTNILQNPACEQKPKESKFKDKGKLFGGKRPSAPAWALRKSDSSGKMGGVDSTDSNIISVDGLAVPQSRWASRADVNQLHILGKPISRMKGPDRHKLTLEITQEEATWKRPPASSPSTLAKTLEDSDAVLMEDNESDDSSDITSDDADDVVDGGVDKDGESDEDALNKTTTQLDELEEHALKLETWLERKLREEVALDEDFCTSFKNDKSCNDDADVKIIKKPSDRQAKFSSSGKAALGQSLSSTFFSNIKAGNKINPPREFPVPDSSEYNGDDLPPAPSTSEVSSSYSSDAIIQKRQETALAVAQMRERLRQMGVLEKSGKVVASESSENNEKDNILPPPPPVLSEGLASSIVRENVGGATKLEVNIDSMGTQVGVDDDDTASTVSGGSETCDNVNNIDDGDNVNELTTDLSVEEEETMRQLLSNLNEAREKAMSAYTNLVSKKNAALSASNKPASAVNNANASTSDTSSKKHHLAPPTFGSSPVKSKGANIKWMDDEKVSSSLDILLNDFEVSFEALTQSTSNALSNSANGNGLYKSTILSKWSDSGKNRSLPAALPTVTESYENMLETNQLPTNLGDNPGSSHDFITSQQLLTENSSQLSLRSSSAVDNNTSIEAILEKYSDKIATMVSAKVLSASQQSAIDKSRSDQPN